MKVRVCPQCGKHNSENTFNCIHCGETLSVNTLVDEQSENARFLRVCPHCGKHNAANALTCVTCGETLSVNTLIGLDGDVPDDGKPVAGQPALSRISPFFEEEVEKIITGIPAGVESILWGCNINKLTDRAPFLFGFLMVTSQRLFVAYFETDPHSGGDENPARPRQVFLTPLVDPANPDRQSLARVWVLGTPKSALTAKETASRQLTTCKIQNLETTQLLHYHFENPKLFGMQTRFIQNDDFAPAFIRPDNDEKAYEQVVVNFTNQADAEKTISTLEAARRNKSG